jgi:hypothetical protein
MDSCCVFPPLPLLPPLLVHHIFLILLPAGALSRGRVEVEAQQDDHDGAAMAACWLPCTVLSSKKQSVEQKDEETKITSNWAIIASQLTSGKKIRDKNAKLLLCSQGTEPALQSWGDIRAVEILWWETELAT